MKQVRLKTLELTNYRNIEHEIYQFNGANAKIVGENRIGKTNTLEALYFLLTNYLLDSSSDLTAIKCLKDTKRIARVSGTFLVDEQEITLTKEYGEEWTKTRGTGELVLKGHYETYYFNGIEQGKAKDYYNLLQEYFGVRNDEKGTLDLIQATVNPLYLGNLGDSKDWTTLRAFIVKLIGDVDNSEVFEKEPSTKIIEIDLNSALGKTELVKKKYLNDIADLETKITADESNIELLEKTYCPSDDEIAVAKKGIEEHETKIAQLRANTGSDKATELLEKELLELKATILETEKKEWDEFNKNEKDTCKVEREQRDKISSQINALVENKSDNQVKANRLETEILKQELVIKSYSDKKKELAEKYKKLKARLVNIDSEITTVCPTCNRPLEKEDIETAKTRLVDGLNNEINNIVIEGQQIASEIKEQEAHLEILKNEKIKLEEEIASILEEIKPLSAEYERLDTFIRKESISAPVFKESQELGSLRDKQFALEEKIRQSKIDFSTQNQSIRELISQEEQAIIPFKKVLDDKSYYDRQMVVLEQIRTYLVEHQKALGLAEQKKEALNKFIYTKLRLLDEHVAKVFGKIKFQLIKENINGGFDPVCKPFIYNIDKQESTNTLWKSGSKSEKIITGIAIAECIKRELNLTELPYLFDEGGEISTDTFKTKFKTNAQIICVKVEDNILKPVVVNF